MLAVCCDGCAQVDEYTGSNLEKVFLHRCGESAASDCADVGVIPNRNSTVLHTLCAHFTRRFARFVPRVIHSVSGVRIFEGVPLEAGPETGGRSGAPTSRTVLHPPPVTNLGGTLVDPTNGRAVAAQKHLNLIRERAVVGLVEATMYVNLAYTYGLEVDDIARESGMPVELVRRLLLGGL